MRAALSFTGSPSGAAGECLTRAIELVPLADPVGISIADAKPPDRVRLRGELGSHVLHHGIRRGTHTIVRRIALWLRRGRSAGLLGRDEDDTGGRLPDRKSLSAAAPL